MVQAPEGNGCIHGSHGPSLEHAAFSYQPNGIKSRTRRKNAAFEPRIAQLGNVGVITAYIGLLLVFYPTSLLLSTYLIKVSSFRSGAGTRRGPFRTDARSELGQSGGDARVQLIVGHKAARRSGAYARHRLEGDAPPTKVCSCRQP